MKVAILSESPADEEAMRVLLEALLGSRIEIVPRRARPGGWNSVMAAIPPTVKELHYRRTAAALVVVLDSDNSPIHRPDHQQSQGYFDPKCRLCQTQAAISSVLSTLTPVPGALPLDTAVAVAVPAIEAWYQCGLDPSCTEAGWTMRQNDGKSATAEILRLKRAVYGTDRPGLHLLTQKAVENAERLAGILGLLEQSFPNTFGHFAAEVRSWRV